MFVYLDDILVASETNSQHRHHLRLLFRRLEQNGLVINRQKCVFGVTNLDFLGHHISAEGASPSTTKVDAIINFPAPVSTKALQEWLGMINYYHRFIPHAAALLKPLHEAALAEPFQWTPQMQSDFDTAKAGLSGAVMLFHPSHTAPTSITVDASDIAVGGALEQYLEGEWKPLAFFSRKLDKAQTRYSAFDRELLAMYLSVRCFRYFVEGRAFTLFTDHKPLIFAFSNSSDSYSPRVYFGIHYRCAPYPRQRQSGSRRAFTSSAGNTSRVSSKRAVTTSSFGIVYLNR